MAELRSFLTIERALSEQMERAVDVRGRSIVRDVEEAIRAGDMAEADQTIRAIDFRGVIDTRQGRIEEIAATALLFGVDRIGNVNRSTMMRRGLPPEFNGALHQLKRMMEDRAAHHVRERLLKLLAQLQDPSAGDSTLDPKVALLPSAKAERMFDSYADLKGKLNEAVLGGGRLLGSIGANLTTSRLVNFGALAEAQATGMDAYQLAATLDERTSEICLRLHGRTFSVNRSYELLAHLLKLEDPEELKVASPFVKSDKPTLARLEKLTSDELAEQGIMVPPFHPWCRTVVVRVGAAGPGPKYTPVMLEDDPRTPWQMPAAHDGAYVTETEAEQALKFLESITVRSLPSDQIRAVDRYTGSIYRRVNEHLRGLYDYGSEIPDLEEAIAGMRAALAAQKTLPRPINLYRGVAELELFGLQSVDDLDGLIGRIFQDRAFVSTSLLRERAAEFVSRRGALIRIEMPAGSKIIPVPSLLENVTLRRSVSSEWEMILEPGTSFQVVAVESVGVGGKTLPQVVLKPILPALKSEVRQLRGDDKFVWSAGNLRLIA